ncbi:carboxylesterase [Roseibium sp. TrichSKD4]|nr:carboxylesterase [Roseibium sp. TrichSKD4]
MFGFHLPTHKAGRRITIPDVFGLLQSIQIRLPATVQPSKKGFEET